MVTDLKVLGARCREFRINKGCYQYQVAIDTGYSKENISAFENGRNDNSRILLWYILQGMAIDDIKGIFENGKNV